MRWMLVLGAVIGCVAGVFLGYLGDWLLLPESNDGVAFIVFCALCGILIGVKLGERHGER